MTGHGIRSITRALALLAASSSLAFAGLAFAANAGTGMPDAWITTKVKLALFTTEGVPATDVNVDTIDGKVTLHGSVATAGEKAKAQDAARAVQGVQDVRNLLQIVKPSAHAAAKVADAQLTQDVSAALTKDAALADSDIEVASVNQGAVLLSGTAQTLSDSLRAVEIAARVDGVRRVASEIESPDELGDAEVWRDGQYDAAAAAGSSAKDMWTTSAVKMSLLANSKTPGFDINVDTEAGRVTLFGVVDSQEAKKAAGAEAAKVDGVTGVANELQVVAPGQQETVAANDETIDAAVSKRLDANARLEGSDIEIDVKNGIVHLSGTVNSQSDRITALTMTRSTQGVRGLVDDLRISAPAVSAK
jgi:osmotically-inducible protein OsmY